MKLRDYIIIASLLIISIVLLIAVNFSGNRTTLAEVYHQNKVIITIDFKNKKSIFTKEDDPDKADYGYPHYELDNNGFEDLMSIVVLGTYIDEKQLRTELVIEIDYSNNSVRIREDKTPNQIAVNRGWYDGLGLPLISAPNEIKIIFVDNNKNDVDIGI